MELPENSLLGNQLFFPSYNKTTRQYTLKTQTSRAGLYIAALPKKTKFNLILDGFNLFNHSNQEIIEGSLNQYHLNWRIGHPKIISLEHGIRFPQTLNQLLENKLIEQTTYTNFFNNQNFHQLDNELRQIPEHLQQVYFVTKLGHDKISLIPKQGEKTPKKQSESLIEKLTPSFN